MSDERDDTGHAASWYAATTDIPPPRPLLLGETRADVVVVGGGYTGLSAALHLAEAGADVVLLEAGRLGGGASGVNGGQIHSGQRRDQLWLEQVCGDEAARALWTLAEEAKALVRSLVDRHGIDCDLTHGLVHAAHRPRLVDDLRGYVDHLRNRYDYGQVEALDRDALRAIVPGEAYHGGLIDHGGGHLHPLRFALGLARAAAAAGARLHEGSRVLSIARGGKVRAVTAAGAVTADVAILAGNAKMGGLDREVDRRVFRFTASMIATAPLGARAREVLTRDVAVDDTRRVVNYFRLTPDGRLLFGGGESFDQSMRRDHRGSVRRAMLAVFPQLRDVAIDHAWNGPVALTPSRLPFVRRLAPGILVAAGFSGQGVALAPLMGKLLADAARGESEAFDRMAALPVPALPGGRWAWRPAVLATLAVSALRDRL